VRVADIGRETGVSRLDGALSVRLAAALSAGGADDEPPPCRCSPVAGPLALAELMAVRPILQAAQPGLEGRAIRNCQQRGNEVRTGLPAGGSRIRTLGPASSTTLFRDPRNPAATTNWPGSQNRILTIDKGRFTVRRARLAPEMISTPGHRASRRRQRGALPAWSLLGL
jgi:hypothetical protein